MKSPLLFLSILSFGLVQAQDQIEWFQPGHEWYYNVYCLQTFGCGYTYYEVNDTEILDGKEASVLTRIYLDESMEDPLLDTEYLRFENDTAWRYSAEAEEWHMLWDIGAEPGDIWTIQEDVFYGYSYDGVEPDEVPLFKVMVDSVAFWAEVPNSPLTNRRMVYVSPVVNEMDESTYTFGPILEGVGPVGGAHDLIGNSTGTALPLQSPYFQCFLDGGVLTYGSDQLAYGSGSSPCFTLETSEVEEVDQGLIYPNPATETIFWDEPITAIQLFDAVGKLVLQTNQARGSLSVDRLEAGLYTVVIERGGQSFSQKLMITK
jgi:hypothetical protein